MRADDTDTTEAEGGWLGNGVGRKRPLSKIRHSAIQFDVSDVFMNLQ